MRKILIALFFGLLSSCQQEGKPLEAGKSINWSATDTAEINAIVLKGLQFLYNNPDSADHYFLRAEEKSREVHYPDGIGFAMQYRGYIAVSTGNYQKGFDLYEHSMPYCLNARYIVQLPATLYINMGTSYVYTGDYKKASMYYYRALQYLTRHIPNDSEKLIVYINLSAVQIRLGQYNKALYYIEQVEQAARKKGAPFELAGTLNNKGDVFIALHRFDEAESVLREAYDIAGKHGLLMLQQSVLCSQGELALSRHREKEAIAFFSKAMELSSATGPFYGSIVPQYKLGIAYYRLGNYGQAEKMLLSALAIAGETGLMENNRSAYETLAAIYEATGRYQQALAAHRTYTRLTDSATNKEKTSAISELEIKYNSAQKDKALAQKQLQISQQENRLAQKNIWIGGISLGALLLALLLISRNRINKQKQESQAKQIHILEQQQEIFKQEQEIGHLKAMMQGEEKERVRIARDLHDGIVSQLLAVRLHFAGTLQNKMGSVLYPDDFKDTIRYLDDATKDLRITAHNLMPETVLNNGLVAALHTYCTKISEASDARVEFHNIGAVGRMDSEIELSLFRIVQELVQNAQKHARAGHILVQLNGQSSLLSITVEDDGIGCDAEDIARSSGMGLKSIAARVQALKGDMDFNSKKGMGTTVYLEFHF